MKTFQITSKKCPFNPRVGIRNISDYSPFGVLLKERTIETANYRRGFQGQETDDEVKGEGNSVNYKYRMHDPRVGRFFTVDPLFKEFPWYTPYSFSGNEVTIKIELEGLEPSDHFLTSSNVGKSFIGVSQAQGQEGQKYYWKLCSNPSKTSIWWEQGKRYVPPPKPKPEPKPDPITLEAQQYNDIADNNARINYTPTFGNIVKEEKSAAEKFEDKLWNTGTIWEYVRYKLNQADQRYEGSKGLENFARDGLVVVNTAGQLAMFVPGGQGAGSLMMGFADLGETAFDINDYGLTQGLMNGAIRWGSGKVGEKFIPSQFVGSKTYKIGYEGGVTTITELTENEAVDYLNSLNEKKE